MTSTEVALIKVQPIKKDSHYGRKVDAAVER